MLILIVGPSGAGKDTLLNGLREVLDDQAPVRFVRRVITRPADDGQERHEGVSLSDFQIRQDAGDFTLSWCAHGLHYGIPADVALDLAQGRIVVANVSRAVVADAARRFPVAVVEIDAHPEKLAYRLERRGRELPDDIARRLSRAIELPLPVERYRITNDGTVERGVQRLLAAIEDACGRRLGR